MKGLSLANEDADIISNTDRPKPTISIGIDLGTTFSSVAYESKKLSVAAQLIYPNDCGSPYVPSIVYYGTDCIEIGEDALNHLPQRTIIHNKRFIGLAYKDIKDIDTSRYPYRIYQSDDGNIRYELPPEFAGGNKTILTPLQVHTEMLKKLREIALHRIGSDNHVQYVISHPSYFVSSQKQATLEAGMYIFIIYCNMQPLFNRISFLAFV